MYKSLYFYLVVIGFVFFYNCKKNKDAPVDCDTENTGLVKRVEYGSSSLRQNLELYLPNNYSQNTKVVILVHGGAWILGPDESETTDLFSGDLGWDLVQKLLDNGYGAAVMKYRLACYNTDSAFYTGDPMHFMKDMIEDIDLAVNQLKVEAANEGFSATDFGLIGESAGAHISLLYALKSSSDPAIKTVLSFYSPHSLDDQTFKTNGANAPFNNLPAMLGGKFGVERRVNNCNYASSGNVNLFFAIKTLAGYNMKRTSSNPSNFVDTLSPSYSKNIQRNIPTFILHGSVDGLVPQYHADSIINAITAKHGTNPAAISDFTSIHKMKKYNGCNHGFGGCNQTPIMNDVITWLNNHL